jgi:3-oxoadipate enol-lactonase
MSANPQARDVFEQFPSHRVIVGDYTTRLLDTGGAGSPVVLIHALATDHRMWRDVLAHLAPRHRVIAYDVRGHGIAAGAAKPYSVPMFAADVRLLLDRLQIARAHIYGISMGGAIAQQFAVDHPDRVLSLALIATFSKADPVFAQRGQTSLPDGMASQIAPTLSRWFTPDALAVDAPGVQYARTMLLRAQADDWRASWMALSAIAFYPQLASIRVPTKVIAGELDTATSPDLMRNDIASRIPRARLIVIPGAAHLIALEKGAELAAALLESL